MNWLWLASGVFWITYLSIVGGISFLLAQKLKRNRILWPIFGTIAGPIIVPILTAMALSQRIDNPERRTAAAVGLSIVFIILSYIFHFIFFGILRETSLL